MSGRASNCNGTRGRSTRKTRSYQRSLPPLLPPSAKLARRAVVREIALKFYENQRTDCGRVMYGAMKVLIDESRHIYPLLSHDQVNRQLRHIKKGKENDIVATSHNGDVLLEEAVNVEKASKTKSAWRPKGTTLDASTGKIFINAKL